MRLVHSVRGISRLIMILFLIIFFLLGATLSYIWTFGVISNLPSYPSVSVEKVEFFVEDATYLNVTVLNPSYSSSNATIEQVKVETGGILYNTTTPSLPFSLASGDLHTFKSFWNWGNFSEPTMRVHAIVSGGLGSNLLVNKPFMNFKVTDVNFNASETVDHFNITVQNAGSSTFVNITKILVAREGAQLEQVATDPALPYGLTNASDSSPTTLVLRRNWLDLQGGGATIALQTLRGYTAYYSVNRVPQVILNVTSVSFDPAIRDRFNVTVLNAEFSDADVDILEVIVSVPDNTTIIQTGWTAYSTFTHEDTRRLNRKDPTIITCPLTWSIAPYIGQKATITVVTVQGFQVSYEKLIS